MMYCTLSTTHFGLLTTMLALLYSICSCNSRPNTSDSTAYPVINVKEYSKHSLEWSDIADSVSVLELSTDSGEYVAQIEDACFTDSSVYVLDGVTKSIAKFNRMTGILQQQIRERGNGPLEYVNPIRLACDSQMVYLLDLSLQSILVYDHHLNAQERIRLPFAAFEFTPVDDGFLCYNLSFGNELHQIVHVGRQGQVLDSFLPPVHERPAFVVVGENVFSRAPNGHIHILPPYTRTVYEWDATTHEVHPCFQFDFGNKNLPKDVDPNRTYVIGEGYTVPCNFFQTGSCFLTAFMDQTSFHYHVMRRDSYDPLAMGTVKQGQKEVPFVPRWQTGNQLVGTCTYQDIAPYMEKTRGQSEEKDGDVLLFFTLKHS